MTYVEELALEHYGMAICAAARSQMIVGFSTSKSKGSYKYKKIMEPESSEVIKLLLKCNVDVAIRA